MSAIVSGLGALGGSAVLKLRATSAIFWRAVTNETRTRVVKNGNKSFNQPYVDKNSWYRDGDYIDPVTGKKVTYRESMTGADDPNNVSHTFVTNMPVVITDLAGVTQTKMMSVSVKVMLQKHDDITGDHIRSGVIQGFSEYLGTITSGEPAVEGFIRIKNGMQLKA